MSALPDLVRLTKLDTSFLSDGTQHIRFVAANSLVRQKVEKRETWKKQRELGRGTFGIVCLEECISGDPIGQFRAVKSIQKLRSTNYRRELEALALFSNERYEHCFVKSFGWFEDINNIFFAMEYLANMDLTHHLNQPLPEAEAKLVTQQVAEGLCYMHEYGFTHRDLKPANILVVEKGPQWWVKISDFGISKRTHEGLTALRTHVGTPAFAAPEVLGFIVADDEDGGSYSSAVDIWSLGVITFFMLTNTLLFTGIHRVGQFVSGSMKFPIHVLRDNLVSPEGCAFVQQLVKVVAEERPSAADVLDIAWVANVRIKSLVSGSMEKSASVQISSPPILTKAEASGQWTTVSEISKQNPPPISPRQASLSSSEIEATENNKQQPQRQVMEELRSNTLRENSADHYQISERHRSIEEKLYVPVSHETDFISSPIRLPGQHWDFLLSPNSNFVVTHDDLKMKLWELRSASLKWSVDLTSRITMWYFTFDSNSIVTTHKDTKVRVTDLETGEQHTLFLFDLKSRDRMAFSPVNSSFVVWNHESRVLNLWAGLKGERIVEFKLRDKTKEDILELEYFDNGSKVFLMEENQCIIFDLVHNKFTLVHFSQDFGLSETVWRVNASLSPRGSRIVFASGVRAVIYNSESGSTMSLGCHHSGYLHNISPDGRLVLSFFDDRVVIRNTENGEEKGFWQPPIKEHWMGNAVFSPDSRMIDVSQHHGTSIHIICSTTFETFGSLPKGPDWSVLMRFTADLKYFVCCGSQHEVHVWRVDDHLEGKFRQLFGPE